MVLRKKPSDAGICCQTSGTPDSRSPGRGTAVCVHRLAILPEFDEAGPRDAEEPEHSPWAAGPDLQGPAQALRDDLYLGDRFLALELHICDRAVKSPAPLDLDHGRVILFMDHEVAYTAASPLAERDEAPGPRHLQGGIDRSSRLPSPHGPVLQYSVMGRRLMSFCRLYLTSRVWLIPLVKRYDNIVLRKDKI